MKMYRRQLLKEFLPFLCLGVLFFSLMLVLADIFANLWRYLNKEIPFSRAMLVSLLYGPKAFSYALPIGAMFAAAFSLGTLGARNELIAVFGSGVPLFRFVVPILVIAMFLSVGGYFFEDRVVIPLLKSRNTLSKELLGIQDSNSRSQAVAISQEGRVVYYADYYNAETQVLTGITIVIQDIEGDFKKRIDAERGIWDSEKNSWLLESCRVFTEEKEGEIVQEYHAQYEDEWVVEEPATFRLDTREIEEMNDAEARLWIETQKRGGFPYKAHQAKLYQRYSIALTPFLVVLFAGALGGRFKRNILLMSLLVSLGLAAGWYIVRMVSTLLSELGLVDPLPGAVVPYLVFLAFGIWFFRSAKS